MASKPSKKKTVSAPTPLASWLAAAAKSHPDLPALEAPQGEFTYAQLHAAVRALAGKLAAAGIGAGDRVAIAATRSADTIIAILAVVESGAGYVPLDTGYPAERLQAMLEGAQPRVVLGESDALARLRAVVPEFPTLENPGPRAQAPFAATDDLAYVLFTSGSTGKPKGVAMGTRPLAHLIDWHARHERLGQRARTLQFAPLSFDVHFQEIFSTLACSGTLVVIAEDQRRDPARLHAALIDKRVQRIFLPYVALQMIADASRDLVPTTLREAVSAGEQLQITPAIRELFRRLPDAELHNHYGPTESHVVTAHELRGDAAAWPEIPPIGLPLPHVTLAVRNEEDGAGELLLGGETLADGYIGRADLTVERFRDDLEGLPGRWYVTGDLVRRDADGVCTYLGRADQQVKVDGFRIEPGEIEIAIMADEAVKDAVVAAPDIPGAGKQLVAYLVAREGAVADENLFSRLRAELRGKLPEYMVPVRWVPLERLPTTPSGKIDRKSLPIPQAAKIEKTADPIEIVRAVWQDLLGVARIGDDQNLFDLGAKSLLVLRFVARLREAGMDQVTVADVYDQPTVRGIAAGSGEQTATRRARRADGATRGIAIVGMAARVPGAANVEEFWSNLVAGREGIRHFTLEELDPSVPESIRTRSNFVAARGVIADADRFDATFFGVSQREAVLIDPQQRLLLELSWNALEHAAIDSERANGTIGVYVGTANNTYAPALRAEAPELIQQAGEFAVMLASEKDYAATRVANRLDLKGPAVSVHTACSTGLVAVTQAWHALAGGQCDVAIAGGATLVVPQNGGYLHIEGAMESADGHCRPFDADATGTVFASGGAVVVLKRLEDAERDGDNIYAVIRGVGINNDGIDKASFTAPSVSGQADAIRMALDHAGVGARDIGYVEAHGTATTLGDPIEIAALTRAWRADTADNQYCGIGSLKGNLGHMVAAAGVAGLIKATLSLHRELVPATLHFRKPNPQIDFTRTPFTVVDRNLEWKRGAKPRFAAVSSFGVGGTNAHVVLEEAPVAAAARAAEQGLQVLPLSARSAAALRARAASLAAHLDSHPHLPLADVIATAVRGRRVLEQRAALVARDTRELAQALRKLDSPVAALARPRLVFMFPGQGSQHPGMARELYAESAAFREAFDRCLEILAGHSKGDFRRWLLDSDPADATVAELLSQTRHAQPALFMVSYSLASWLDSLGVRPDAMIGHSIGEYVAACRAGVFSVEHALAAVVERGEAMFSQPRGSMLAVKDSAAKVAPLLGAGVEIAACNAPNLTVVSGSDAAIDALEASLPARGIGATRLKVSHGFHSASMDGALPRVEAALRAAKLAAPRVPMYSCVSGELLEQQALDPNYWARQVRAPVQFSKALLAEAARGPVVFAEVGPSQALTALLRQHRAPDGAALRGIPLLGPAREPGDSARQALAAVGALWSAGVAVAWPVAANAPRAVLPDYPFADERHWFVRRKPSVPAAAAIAAPVAVTSSVQVVKVMSRVPKIQQELVRLIGDVSGIPPSELSAQATFLDQGMDSLSFTQATLELERVFGLKMKFRRLMEDLDSLDKLTAFLDQELPADRFAADPEPVAPAVPAHAAQAAAVPVNFAAPAISMPVMAAPTAGMPAVQALIQQQLQLMSQQLAVLAGAPVQAAAHVPVAQVAEVTPQVAAASAVQAVSTPAASAAPTAPGQDSPSTRALIEKPFGASARITLEPTQHMSAEQAQWLRDFIASYNARSGKSKAFSQQYRGVMSDPRVVTGFNPLWKDLVYPIVADRSKGARVWDVDGNEYIDLLSCFGANMLGYNPDDVLKAMHEQLDAGIEVGPQHPMSGEVAQLISEFTGMERVAFCNTGSEAVMGAMRIARTVTGRKTIAIFTNSYHGIFDEVIVRGTKQLRSLSAAPGILANAVENVLVLDYDSPESLEILRKRGRELAAIMIEPIQNKYPTLHPFEFVKSLRVIADDVGCALIFDEVVTGFRVAPGGAQEFYGVRADIATYGKVIGGGLPFAAIAGRPQWLDALDGGQWRYGDDSYPEAGVTYFAGTFVRHPLALAAARAALLHLKRGGREFYRNLNARTQDLADRLNQAFTSRNAPVKAVHCASLWRLTWDDDQKYISLFYYLARFHGLHVYEQFGHFVTEAFGDAEIDRVVQVYTNALDELMALGFIKPRPGSSPGKREVESGDLKQGPLTPGQTERWLAASFDDAARRALNESFCVVFSKSVSVPALRQAVQDVISRHDAFRVSFDRDAPVQHVSDVNELRIEDVDLRSQADADRALDEFCTCASARDFALDRAPLAAVSLLLLADGRVVVHVVASHLVFDGWASSVFNAELAAAYKARETGAVPRLPAAESPVAFGRAEQERLRSADGQASMQFWKEQLRNPPAPLQLGDLSPPSPRRYAADTVRKRFDGELFASLRKSMRESGTTLFQWLLGAVTVSLQRASSSSEFVVSIPYASQGLDRHGPLLADGVLDLPLRLTCGAAEPGREVLKRVRKQLMDALEYPIATQGEVARALGIVATGDKPPLTSVYFNLNPKVDLSAFAPQAVSLHEGRKAGSLNELFFNFYDQGDAISLDLHYSCDHFSRARAEQLVDWLAGIIAQLAASLDAVPALAAAPEIDARLRGWNATDRVLADGCRIEQWVSRQAAATPDEIAITARGEQLLYRDVESRANQFARALIARGVGPGSLVGVCMSRGLDLVPSLLGVLKSGAAYVPLDPGFPRDRLAYMAADANVKVVITEAQVADRSGVERERQLRIDDDAAELGSHPGHALLPPTNAADPEAVAYVIYTSGSTGKPKGVVLKQRSVCNFLQSMRREPGLEPGDRLLAVTTLSFDIAVLELFLPLTCGGHLVLAQREDAMDAYELGKMIAEYDVNVMQATPTTWHLLIDAEWRAPKNFKALCGGEPLPPTLATKLLGQGIDLWNMYGPTETTVWSTLDRVSAAEKINIGKPIDNTTVWVLDEQGRACGPGKEGEICIGGVGVAQGYFNRPELTSEKFIADPFDKTAGARIYRTGDLGRWREDGKLEHLGRLDFQVKIRGFRIELGEIEARMAARPGVARTVVVAREDSPGDIALVGYYVSESGVSVDQAAMRDAMRAGLPEYMVPRHLVALESMPLLPNGKIDRKALPVPGRGAAAAPVVAAVPVVSAAPAKGAPTTAARALPSGAELEAFVADTMAKILGVSAVKRDDHFFELGGHSLLAAKLAAAVSTAFGVRPGLRTIFESPTPAKLAAALRTAAGQAAEAPRASIPRRADQSTAPLSLTQQRLWFLEHLDPGTVTNNLPSAHRLRGPLVVDAMERALRQLIARQSSLRTVIERTPQGARQRVLPALDFKLSVIDVSRKPQGEREMAVTQSVSVLVNLPFDLERGPLFVFRLFKLAADDHVLFFQPHHLIWDGTSFDVFYNEISELYAAELEGRAARLPPVSVSYGDFAAWHNDWMEGDELKRQTEYWRAKLTPLPPAVRLPFDRHPPQERTGNGKTYFHAVGADLAQSLRAQAQARGRTPFVSLLSAFALAIQQAGGQRDFVVGTPVRGREDEALEPLMGFFVNMLPVPMQVDPSARMDAWLDKVQASVAECFSSPDVPFDHLVRQLKVPRDNSRTPIYQVSFSYQDVRERPTRWGNLSHERFHIDMRGSPQDIGLYAVETANTLELVFNYNTDVFDEAMIADFAVRVENVLRAIAADASRPLSAYGEVRELGRLTPALASQAPAATPAATVVGAAQGDALSVMASIWQDLLGVSEVRPTDNFFDLGGHSLLAMRVISEVEHKLGVRISVRRLIFENLGQLAASSAAERASAEPARAATTGVAPAAGADKPGPKAGEGVFGRIAGLFRR